MRKNSTSGNSDWLVTLESWLVIKTVNLEPWREWKKARQQNVETVRETGNRF